MMGRPGGTQFTLFLKTRHEQNTHKKITHRRAFSYQQIVNSPVLLENRHETEQNKIKKHQIGEQPAEATL